MGLERLVALLQGKKSNYDTDLFQPLFDAIQKHSKMPEYKGTFGDDSTGKIDYGYRILADHARMVTVALADNMLPEQQYDFSICHCIYWLCQSCICTMNISIIL